MSRDGRPRKTGGVVFPRSDSVFLWVRYRDRDGKIIKESSGTIDPDEAAGFLRARCEDRDRGRLPAILAAKHLTFNQWADWFLEKRSKPPYRAQKTHEQNMNATNLLRPVFGETRLSDITPESIESYIDRRLREGRRIHTKLLGLVHRGQLKPATVHQEYRVLRRMLNLAVKQKKLESNPCQAVEFPVSVKKSTRKPTT